MIDTAGSVEGFIRALSARKPKEINLIAVHAIFSHPAVMRISRLTEEWHLRRVIVSDTVGTSVFAETIPGLEVVPSTELSARIIASFITHESIGKLMLSFDAEKYLKSPTLFNT
jgi:ribose-phosphate pyrophosphokinase